MTAPPIAVLDSNVLICEWSRIVLQELAAAEPPRFIGIWSSAIVAETWRVLTVQRIAAGSTGSAISNDSYFMWSKLDPILRIAEASRRPPDTPPSPLRDRRDEHLWNAALNAGAQYVVSHNTRHFPPAVLVDAPPDEETRQIVRHFAHGIEFLTAIEFIEDVLDEDAAALYGQPLPPGIIRSRRARLVSVVRASRSMERILLTSLMIRAACSRALPPQTEESLSCLQPPSNPPSSIALSPR